MVEDKRTKLKLSCKSSFWLGIFLWKRKKTSDMVMVA